MPVVSGAEDPQRAPQRPVVAVDLVGTRRRVRALEQYVADRILFEGSFR
jgi:hypothetical protein